MSYQVPQHISKDKIFIVNRSEIERRLEPEFYRPPLSSLEKRIRSLATHKLRDYAISFAGGATPKKTEAGSFYTDSENGIPFLRVQNLQTNGELSLSGCIYINEETHNGLLARSQVSEGDLLVKITGVGRMAIASVAPDGFVGNTNQHMVVIKTGDASLSKYLARYLNLDIIEKIASRHSTGGTRPALDYPSLKSIPIIEGIDFSPIDNAIKQKKEKEYKAQQYLDSIDTYILDELDVSLPEYQSDLKDRIFTINRKTFDNRWDPYYSQKYFRDAFTSLEYCNYPIVNLKNITKLITSGITPKSGGDAYTEDKEIGVPFVRSGNISIEGELDFDDLLYLKPEIHETLMRSSQLQKNDILIAIVGATIGQVGIYPYDGGANINQAIALVRLKDGYNVQFIKELIKSSIGQLSLNRLKRPVARANINLEEISTIKVVLPPLDKQQEIADHIADIRKKAKSLQDEGKRILESAKQEVERMILQ